MILKIFISYSHADSEIAKIFYGYLQEHGFEVSSDIDLTIGDIWQEKLSRLLSASDVVLVLVSDASMKSGYVKAEIMKVFNSKKQRLFPYIVNGTESAVISYIENITYFIGTDNIYDDIELIAIALQGIKEIVYTQKKEDYVKIGNIGINLDSYIHEAVETLLKYEKRNLMLSYLMYIFSFLLLASFLLIAVNSATYRSIELIMHYIDAMIPADMVGTAPVLPFSVLDFMLFAIVDILIFSIILIMSRFAFILGKSFMAESIRNADRRHAISFGQFFIKAYGNEATRDEIREVFREWNIDKGSLFNLQDIKDTDPYSHSAIDLIKTVLTKK